MANLRFLIIQFQRLTSHLRRWKSIFRGKKIFLQPGFISSKGVVFLGPRAFIKVEFGGELVLQGNLVVDRDVEIVVYPGGRLVIGDNVYIGHATTIACSNSISIGSESSIADLVSIRDMNHRRIPGKLMRESGVEIRPIAVGNNCWLGSKVTLVPGCELGDDVTVAANSAVSGKFDDEVLIGGVPARIIKSYKVSSSIESN